MGLSTDSEKLKSLYDEAVLNIPYQTIRFNYDGSIPHTPDEVLVNRWGDCKDKSVLMTCMLRHVGIEAWPVLVRTRSDGTQMPIPTFGFNHLVLACMIDGDTVYVDPTGIPFAPKHSLGKSVAGQPCLHIKGTTSSQLTPLPRLSPEDLIEKWELTLTPDSVGRYDFQINREYRNVAAGYRRQPYFDDSYSELVKNKESYFASEWGVTMDIDTLIHDEIKATSEAFCDGWSGTVDVVTQELGKNLIVSPPRWSVFDKSILPRLSGYVERTQPVDLWQYSGNDVRVMKYTVPEGWDAPEIADPVEISDSLVYFSFEWEWDPDSRVVLLTYSLSIEDGLIPVASFASFVERVIDVFESPLLLKKAQTLAIKTVKA